MPVPDVAWIRLPAGLSGFSNVQCAVVLRQVRFGSRQATFQDLTVFQNHDVSGWQYPGGFHISSPNILLELPISRSGAGKLVCLPQEKRGVGEGVKTIRKVDLIFAVSGRVLGEDLQYRPSRICLMKTTVGLAAG